MSWKWGPGKGIPGRGNGMGNSMDGVDEWRKGALQVPLTDSGVHEYAGLDKMMLESLVGPRVEGFAHSRELYLRKRGGSVGGRWGREDANGRGRKTQ